MLSNMLYSNQKSRQEQLHGGGRAQVKANLLGTSAIIEQFLFQMYNKNMFDIENEGQSDAVHHPQ